MHSRGATQRFRGPAYGLAHLVSMLLPQRGSARGFGARLRFICVLLAEQNAADAGMETIAQPYSLTFGQRVFVQGIAGKLQQGAVDVRW